MTYQEQVAEEVRVAMARRRISQKSLAEAIGKSQPFMSRRLNGETPFDVAELDAIAGVLDVPIASLVVPEGIVDVRDEGRFRTGSSASALANA